jgi:hypothetical protein
MSLFENGDPVTFDALVGEGKKYKDPDAVAKAIIEKDRFIEQLKAEKAEVLRDLTTRQVPDRSQEILDRLNALNTRPATESPVTEPTERVEVKGLSEDDVLKLLQQRDAKARAEANVNAVKAELKKKFGDQYQTALNTLQEKMGVDQKFLDNIAAQSPAAFMQLLGGEKPEAVFTPPTSTRPETFKPTNTGPQPRSHYLKLKAENRSEYDKPATQNKMYKDAMAMGEAFFDVRD